MDVQSSFLNKNPFKSRMSFGKALNSFKEIKYCDVLSGTMTGQITQTVGQLSLNVPIIGTGFNNRVGNKIAMKSIFLNGYISINGTNTAALPLGDYIRILIVYDLQPNGIQANYNDFIQSTNTSGTLGNTVLDHVNINNRKRFIILMDEKFQVGPVGVTGGSSTNAIFVQPDQLVVKRFIKLKGLQTVYKGSTTGGGVVGDISQGNLQFCILAANSTATTGAYTFNGTARLAYID